MAKEQEEHLRGVDSTTLDPSNAPTTMETRTPNKQLKDVDYKPSENAKG